MARLLFHCPVLPEQRLSNPATITGMPEFSATKGPIPSRNRVAHALLVAAKGFLITAAKTAYALWLEVTGLIFAVLTVSGGSALVRQYRTDHLADHRRFLTVTVFTLVCGWFTVLSFVKAKRTRR
jgi:hypothetical protein